MADHSSRMVMRHFGPSNMNEAEVSSSSTSEGTSTDTSDAESSRVDPLEDFLARYSFAYAPEYVLKLRRR